MKRVLAILALIGLLLALPLAAVASASGDGEPAPPPEQADGLQPPADGDDDGSGDEQGTTGDPHDLGGGFRGVPAPPSQNGLDDLWWGPTLELLLMMV
jgi:hypothetical protein